jgi:DNA-binding transcriptional ArsR family regulator
MDALGHASTGGPYDVGARINGIDGDLHFQEYRTMRQLQPTADEVIRYAENFSAIGAEPRLRIMRLLLSAHPEGLVVGELQAELDIPNSTLSHHLDKPRNHGLVTVHRESTFLRYAVDTDALQELLGFLYAECCTRNKAIQPAKITQLSK